MQPEEGCSIPSDGNNFLTIITKCECICGSISKRIGLAVLRVYADTRRGKEPDRFITSGNDESGRERDRRSGEGHAFVDAAEELAQRGFDAIIFITIHYLALGVMLNAYDVPVGRPVSQLYKEYS